MPLLPSHRPGKVLATPLIVTSSHKNSSIEYRERLVRLLESSPWRMNLPASEWALLKTCNRVELVLSSEDPRAAAGRIHEWAESNLGEARLYFYEGADAVTHLFRLAAGLDSMMVSDGQILVQLRAAGKQAKRTGSSRAVLSPLFDAAVNAGMRVRPAYREASTSVAEFAVELALKELGHAPRNVLLIGTGKMSKIVASLLEGSKIHVVSRRSELPQALAGASLVSWPAIPEVLRRSELVVSATSHPGFSIKARDLSDRKRRVLVDLGFPRNIEPSVRSMAGVRLLDLDDLSAMAGLRRVPGTARVEKMVQAEASRFDRWLRASKLSPEIPQLFRWADQVRTEETETVLRSFRTLSYRERRLIEAMGKRITSKILARPAAFAKESSTDLPQEERSRIIRAVFMEDSS
ncbi:MAG: glutamyl-tRNA reductase [Thaumarchaeota archaeon]|nr:glutamyl-tRNA reductase [Nitrososphaerota archaeon]